MYIDDTPSVDFCSVHIQGINTLEDTMRRTNFPVLLNEEGNSLLKKWIYSPKVAYVRVKKEITKFCDKLSMKVKVHIEFNSKKYNLNYKSHVYKIKL